MAPPSGLHQSAIPSDFETPFPVLVRASTLPANLKTPHRADPAHLAPEDAYAPVSPPRRPLGFDGRGHGSGTDSRPRRLRAKDPTRSRSKRRKRFQKLLWVKQSYPDNYTDQATFLENLQRNPRVQPYDFWPLVADSTVIVQHVCSVIIFVVCFVGIFQERVSPVSVVGWGSFATFVGWLVWDYWVTEETADDAVRGRVVQGEHGYREYRPPRRQDSGLGQAMLNASTASISSTSNLPSAASSTSNLLQDHHHPAHRQPSRPPPGRTITDTSGLLIPAHPRSHSASSIHSAASTTSPAGTARLGPDPQHNHHHHHLLHHDPSTSSPARGASGRAYVRVSTIKSAILIYFTLLGLSPILKSLTRSTSSDSIWAMSFWLLAINIFFFDYSGTWRPTTRRREGGGGGGGGAGGPPPSGHGQQQKRMPVASLSTNAALMASTVLASRLPSTGQVFSLTLFSIEVFGLFPVFRQYARQRSWRYHVVLTVLLVLGAGGGVGMVMGEYREGGGGGGGGCGFPWACWPWKRALVGMVVGCLISALAMGGCSWWLIGLQKYKNEIYGPWDPARPIIISRRHWDDE